MSYSFAIHVSHTGILYVSVFDSLESHVFSCSPHMLQYLSVILAFALLPGALIPSFIFKEARVHVTPAGGLAPFCFFSFKTGSAVPLSALRLDLSVSADHTGVCRRPCPRTSGRPLRYRENAGTYLPLSHSRSGCTPCSTHPAYSCCNICSTVSSRHPSTFHVSKSSSSCALKL